MAEENEQDAIFKSIEPLALQSIHPYFTRFLSDSIQFLSDMAYEYESKLDQAEKLLTRVEIAVDLLKTKTDSVKTNEFMPVTSNTIDVSNNIIAVENEKPVAAVVENLTNEDKEEEVVDIPSPNNTEEEIESKKRVRDNPEYAKFFKLLNLGVPAAQLKLRMKIEGLDPDLLE